MNIPHLCPVCFSSLHRTEAGNAPGPGARMEILHGTTTMVQQMNIVFTVW